MSTSYAQTQFTAQKKESSSAASVLDSSSQGESLQRKADMANSAAQRAEAPRPNNTGMPDNLKSGIESLSGFSMDDVRVHYNSSKPATVQALAYTQGTDIHVAPGQEKHLPHEAWHVAQQMAGRVSPTTNIKGMPVNDNAALEHEADVMGEKAVQCKENQNKDASLRNEKSDAFQIVQRMTTSATLREYKNAYQEEIDLTETENILEDLETHPDQGQYSRLQFVDSYRHCGINPEEVNSALPAKRVKIPNPNVHLDDEPDYIKRISDNGFMDRTKMDRMFAIHELEHLRIINENRVNHLRNDKEHIGEPKRACLMTGDNKIYKESMCEVLKKKIPNDIDENVKEYIRQRLEYIKKPFPDKPDSENDYARECPSVLVELIYFCNNFPQELSDFKIQLCGCYEALTLREYDGTHVG